MLEGISSWRKTSKEVEYLRVGKGEGTYEVYLECDTNVTGKMAEGRPQYGTDVTGKMVEEPLQSGTDVTGKMADGPLQCGTDVT
jgi:hypothetical protein